MKKLSCICYILDVLDSENYEGLESDKDCVLNHHKWCPFCLTDDHHKGTSAVWITSPRVLDHLQSHLQCEILAWLQHHLSFPFCFGNLYRLNWQLMFCFLHGRDNLEVIRKLRSTTANMKLKHQMVFVKSIGTLDNYHLRPMLPSGFTPSFYCSTRTGEVRKF